MVRTKFKCNSITEYDTTYVYHFNAVNGAPENKIYWEYTPTGTFEVSILKSKGKLFTVGSEYLLDISGENPQTTT